MAHDAFPDVVFPSTILNMLSAIVDLTLDSNNSETELSIVMQPDLDGLHNTPQMEPKDSVSLS
jgi:hypothetical protein